MSEIIGVSINADGFVEIKYSDGSTQVLSKVEDLKAIQNALDSLTRTVNDLSGDVDDLQTDYETLSGDVGTAKTDITGLQTGLSAINSIIGKRIRMNSTNPVHIPISNRNFNSVLIIGLIQGVDCGLFLIRTNSGTTEIKNLYNGTTYTGTAFKATVSNGEIILSSTLEAASVFTYINSP